MRRTPAVVFTAVLLAGTLAACGTMDTRTYHSDAEENTNRMSYAWDGDNQPAGVGLRNGRYFAGGDGVVGNGEQAPSQNLQELEQGLRHGVDDALDHVGTAVDSDRHL